MKITNHVCRVGIFPKSDDYFRLQGQADGQINYVTLNEFTIGTSNEAQVVMTDKKVGDYRLKVTVKEKELWLEDLNAASKTVVSGNPINPKEPFHYKSGEVLQIAKTDLIITFELFNRNLEPHLEGDLIVREAKEKADALLSSAQRQLEEKSRMALGEIHAQAEAIHHQAKAEATSHGQKIVERAQVTANDLVASAKNEVELLLKESHGKAANLKSEIAKITEERERLAGDLAQAKTAAAEAVQKKQTLLKDTETTENEYNKIRSQFEEFQKETKKSEAEWQAQLAALKGKSTEYEELAKNSQRLQKEADDACSKLKAQFGKLEKEVSELFSKQNELALEIKKAEGEKAKCTGEINDLKVVHQNDLKNLRQKVDEEFKRQLKSHEAHFQHLREQENVELQYRQTSLENLEAKRLDHQVNEIHKRLLQLISDRAALFGVTNLQDNAEFKNDLRALTGQALIEDFQLRRREVLSTLPSSRRLMAQKRFSHGASRYAGWLISICLLGLLVYVQFGSSFQPDRKPTSTSVGH